MIEISRPPYGLSLNDAARHFGLEPSHNAELSDDTIESQMTINGIRIAVHEPRWRPARSPGRSHVEITIPQSLTGIFTGWPACADQFAAWAATDIIATEHLPKPQSMPLRLPLIDPRTLGIVGLVAVIADEEPISTRDRWWCLVDDGANITRAAGDLHIALHRATHGIDAFYDAHRHGRHGKLLKSACHHAIAAVSHSTTRNTLDRHLAEARPGTVPAFRAVRSITGWKPSHITAALRRHHNLVPRLIDTLHIHDD